MGPVMIESAKFYGETLSFQEKHSSSSLVQADADDPDCDRVGIGWDHRLAQARLGQQDFFPARHFSQSNQVNHCATYLLDSGCRYSRRRRSEESWANGSKGPHLL